MDGAWGGGDKSDGGGVSPVDSVYSPTRNSKGRRLSDNSNRQDSGISNGVCSDTYNENYDPGRMPARLRLLILLREKGKVTRTKIK